MAKLSKTKSDSGIHKTRSRLGATLIILKMMMMKQKGLNHIANRTQKTSEHSEQGK